LETGIRKTLEAVSIRKFSAKVRFNTSYNAFIRATVCQLGQAYASKDFGEMHRLINHIKMPCCSQSNDADTIRSAGFNRIVLVKLWAFHRNMNGLVATNLASCTS
jgi:hypothetical protein